MWYLNFHKTCKDQTKGDGPIKLYNSFFIWLREIMWISSCTNYGNQTFKGRGLGWWTQGYQVTIIITKCSILYVAAVLDPSWID